MKNLNHFEAFKLNKKQMNAIAGGRRECHVTYNDDLGGSFDIVIEQSDVSVAEAESVLKAQHPEATAVVCR